MDAGAHGWAQANTDSRHNPELHQPGGAWRQLKHRVLGTLTALAIVVGLVVVISLTAG